jgi:D-alanyl-D-alanine carboxypeptidase/D-alanyl-D-alanine-endopeptidase (penicillin-binding protein 4)
MYYNGLDNQRRVSTQALRVLIIAVLSRLIKGFLVAAACAAGFPAAAADLPPAVRRALAAAGVPESAVGAVVQEVGSARPLLAVNARRSMNPASTMKIVTTYAALELLGPAFRWKTGVYLDGDDLVLRGTGDPKLDYESFWTLLRSLRSRGLRDIRGDIVLDRSQFAPAAHSRFDDEAFRPYNVPPDALLVNFRSIRFLFLPDYERGAVRVVAEPALPGLAITNTLKLGAGTCPEGRAFRDRIGAAFQSQPPRAAFTGAYPALCGDRELNVALHQPEDYVAGMMRHLWPELGGSWVGRVREGAASPSAKLLYEHESPPLAEVVRDINKFSSNVMARQLYLTIAAETVGAPARPAEAFASIKQFLAKKGIPAPELVMENGSGLSRIERISAANLAAVLQAAWKSAVMPELVSSLPVTAADGTMKKRLKGEGVAGQAHVKTGLLNDARTMAGYVLDRHGRRYAVVMLVNHPGAPQTDAAQDALLAWVYEGPRDPGRATSSPPAASQRHP